MSKLQRVRGMRDLLPDEVRRWRRVEEVSRAVLESFGYAEIRLPLVSCCCAAFISLWRFCSVLMPVSNRLAVEMRVIGYLGRVVFVQAGLAPRGANVRSLR